MRRANAIAFATIVAVFGSGMSAIGIDAARLEQRVGELQGEVAEQTEEMRKQTEILEDLAGQKAAPSWESLKKQMHLLETSRANWMAGAALSFDPDSLEPNRDKTPVLHAGKTSNREFIEKLLREYRGEVTDYGWRAEPIDSQRYLVICEMLLDGEKHDFRFQVDAKLYTCRYEGGSALKKLKPSAKKWTWWPW